MISWGPAPKERPWINTIDAGGPASKVPDLPAIIDTAAFPVSWTGLDDENGSGVANYDVYVSTDAGPYELRLDDTQENSAVFQGQIGHVYAFYSRATDGARTDSGHQLQYLLEILEDPAYLSTIAYRPFSDPSAMVLSFDLLAGLSGNDELVISLLDPDTGEPTLDGLNGYGDILRLTATGLQSSSEVTFPAVVPVPGALGLALLGLAGLSWKRRTALDAKWPVYALFNDVCAWRGGRNVPICIDRQR